MFERHPMVTLSTEHDLQAAYSGGDKASTYIDGRFKIPLMELLHGRQVAAINSMLRDARPSRTLEVAPGPGRLTRQVYHSGELACLEYNDGMIAEGQSVCAPTVQWVQGSAFELPFGQEFDCLYSFRFVRHFRRRDRDRLYQQFRNVLRPQGWLMLDAVNAAVSAPLRAERPEDYPIYDKLYGGEDELQLELADAGFKVVRLEPVQRWFSLQYQTQVLLGPRSRFLCRWAIHVMERLRKGPALEWIVTARKIDD